MRTEVGLIEDNSFLTLYKNSLYILNEVGFISINDKKINLNKKFYSDKNFRKEKTYHIQKQRIDANSPWKKTL